MSRARSVADLGNQNVLDLNANDGTLKVGAGVTIENTGEVQFAGIVTAATVQVGAATTLHSTGLDLGSGTLTCHNITSTGVLTYEDVTSVDSIGIITARDGVHIVSAGASIYSPANNELALYTNSSERVRVDSTGRIGIGTDSTTYKLELHSAPGATNLKIGSRITNADHGISFGYYDHLQGRHGFGIDTKYGGVFSENVFVVRSDTGNVGVGTTAPGHQVSVQDTGAPRIEIACTDNQVTGAGLYMRTLNNGSMVSNATIRTSNNGNLQIFNGTSSDSQKACITSDGELLLGTHTTGPSNQSPKIEAREDGTSNIWRSLINSSNDTADKSAFLGIYGYNPGVFAHDRDMTAWANLYLNTIDPLTLTSGGDVYTGGKFAIGTDSPGGYTFVCEKRDASSTTGTKNLVAKFINTGQNTLELNMYGGATDQIQFAATNQEQTISFLTGVNTASVDSTKTSLLLTQSKDCWLQGWVYDTVQTAGGSLFLGSEASPYGNLGALRDTNARPMIYMGGRYPEITLAHTVNTNANHGPTLRFATYSQSTNTATGSQFVIGANGTGTHLDFGHAPAAQNANVHNGINGYQGYLKLRISTSTVAVTGTFSASATKSFRIPHPLAGLTTTTHLYHTALEGPQADLIYRGVVDLVDGSATVNIDTAARMTEGTFEVLCNNVSCFTSNETDWTAVKGSVSGNILTITAQDNTSTASVSWMVVGERKDQDMIDCHLTDDNGRLITEHEIDSDS